ncbi:MAG TPA: NusG domain II-containing protein [Vicinamibacterales bacterium]|nr:NusG domain II-containing protein [Vicinamibacterales bacterium]HPW19389.1 NusG domain II-containing protein [Vicinamibacterales bacterium]
MTTRREFLNRTLMGGAAFGAGMLAGLGPFGRAAGASRWSLAARVPAGAEADVEALAAELGLDLGRGDWQPLAGGESPDLVLLRGTRLLDPAEWPSQAIALRARWSGHPASRRLRLTDKERRAARRAVVRSRDGILAALDLDRESSRVFRGRDRQRMALVTRGGGVEVVEASCRHQHCLRQGRVGLAGERIVCAPAGLVVTLEA